MASKTRAPARRADPCAKGGARFDSNRARKFGRKIPRQEIPTPRGRPYGPFTAPTRRNCWRAAGAATRTATSRSAAIAADLRHARRSLLPRSRASRLGALRQGPRASYPRAQALLAEAETLEQALRTGEALPAGESGDEETPSLALPLAGGGDTTAVGDAGARKRRGHRGRARGARRAHDRRPRTRDRRGDHGGPRPARSVSKGEPQRPRDGEAHRAHAQHTH